MKRRKRPNEVPTEECIEEYNGNQGQASTCPELNDNCCGSGSNGQSELWHENYLRQGSSRGFTPIRYCPPETCWNGCGCGQVHNDNWLSPKPVFENDCCCSCNCGCACAFPPKADESIRRVKINPSAERREFIVGHATGNEVPPKKPTKTKMLVNKSVQSHIEEASGVPSVPRRPKSTKKINSGKSIAVQVVPSRPKSVPSVAQVGTFPNFPFEVPSVQYDEPVLPMPSIPGFSVPQDFDSYPEVPVGTYVSLPNFIPPSIFKFKQQLWVPNFPPIPSRSRNFSKSAPSRKFFPNFTMPDCHRSIPIPSFSTITPGPNITPAASESTKVVTIWSPTFSPNESPQNFSARSSTTNFSAAPSFSNFTIQPPTLKASTRKPSTNILTRRETPLLSAMPAPSKRTLNSPTVKNSTRIPSTRVSTRLEPDASGSTTDFSIINILTKVLTPIITAQAQTPSASNLIFKISLSATTRKISGQNTPQSPRRVLTPILSNSTKTSSPKISRNASSPNVPTRTPSLVVSEHTSVPNMVTHAPSFTSTHTSTSNVSIPQFIPNYSTHSVIPKLSAHTSIQNFSTHSLIPNSVQTSMPNFSTQILYPPVSCHPSNPNMRCFSRPSCSCRPSWRRSCSCRPSRPSCVCIPSRPDCSCRPSIQKLRFVDAPPKKPTPVADSPRSSNQEEPPAKVVKIVPPPKPPTIVRYRTPSQPNDPGPSRIPTPTLPLPNPESQCCPSYCPIYVMDVPETFCRSDCNCNPDSCPMFSGCNSPYVLTAPCFDCVVTPKGIICTPNSEEILCQPPCWPTNSNAQSAAGKRRPSGSRCRRERAPSPQRYCR